MASLKNKWRKRGRLEFKRETKRYSDGTPWGCDVLFVRVKKCACVIVEPFEVESYRARGQTLSVLCGTYRITGAIAAAKLAREYFNYKAAEVAP